VCLDVTTHLGIIKSRLALGRKLRNLNVLCINLKLRIAHVHQIVRECPNFSKS
jgi:hypothetical protein